MELEGIQIKVGDPVLFGSSLCVVVDLFNGSGTPAPSYLVVRLQKRTFLTGPPVEYFISQNRFSELTRFKKG